jgi:hypothetical protein
MLACILLNAGEFRPKVHPELTNKNPKASTYQSSAKAKEGLTRDAMRIIETIWSCVGDEGLNTHRSIWVDVHTFHSLTTYYYQLCKNNTHTYPNNT